MARAFLLSVCLEASYAAKKLISKNKYDTSCHQEKYVAKKIRKGVNRQCTTQSDALAIPNQSDLR
jgi:hypothetical protein